MKPTMLTLMLCLLLPTSAMESRQSNPIPLSMMNQSVDDMYDGCKPQMAKKVRSKYFPREMKNNNLFKDAWKKTEKCANDKFKTRKNKELTKDEIHALLVYTGQSPNVYGPFNSVVRESANNYTTDTFKYHALYFWLVSALDTLRINKTCRTTYRRTDIAFTGRVDTDIRFGSFTSTSKRPDLTQFGKETCFQIRSCLGAYIKDFSLYPEREVLIPPYERFKILKIANDSYGNLTDCKQIFVVKNAGRLSKLNCKASRKRGLPHKFYKPTSTADSTSLGTVF